jgi:hypothetical protein
VGCGAWVMALDVNGGTAQSGRGTEGATVSVALQHKRR